MIDSAQKEMVKDIKHMAEKCRRFSYKFNEMAKCFDEMEREISNGVEE